METEPGKGYKIDIRLPADSGDGWTEKTASPLKKPAFLQIRITEKQAVT